jgi:hypothetical protein
MSQAETEHGEVKVIPLDPECPHPSLELDEKGLWTFKKVVISEPKPMEVSTKIVKFHALTRTCPVHGEVDVMSRNFQAAGMHSIEGLSCGHSLLITRQVSHLKDSNPMKRHDPKNWVHRGWNLSFKETIKAGGA